MKYAFSSRITPQASLDDMLVLAQEYGYHGIELCLGTDHEHKVELDNTAAELRSVVSRTLTAGVSIVSVVAPCRFMSPNIHHRDISNIVRYLDLTAAIGAECLCITGSLKWPGVSRGLAIDQLIDILSTLAISANSCQVKLFLQTNGYWCDPTYTTEVMKYVDDPMVKFCWDIFPMIQVTDEILDIIFRKLHPWLGHIHVYDGVINTGTVVHLSYGDIDYARVLELLVDSKYPDYLCIDWPDKYPQEQMLIRDLAILKCYEQKAQILF